MYIHIISAYSCLSLLYFGMAIFIKSILIHTCEFLRTCIFTLECFCTQVRMYVLNHAWNAYSTYVTTEQNYTIHTACTIKCQVCCIEGTTAVNNPLWILVTYYVRMSMDTYIILLNPLHPYYIPFFFFRTMIIMVCYFPVHCFEV